MKTLLTARLIGTNHPDQIFFSCGCEYKPGELIQCPLHDAAPEMLKALEFTKQFLHEVHCRWPEDADYGGSVLIDVDKALHNAKKGT